MSDTHRYSRAELAACNKSVIIINNVVYDVTRFLDSHPGGAAVLSELFGKDASQSFYETGHSKYALALLEVLMIGELVDENRQPVIGDNDRPRVPVRVPQYHERRRGRRRFCTLSTFTIEIMVVSFIVALVIINLILYKIKWWYEAHAPMIK